jgi:tRNA (adenine37-N6)-methyltransferase
MELAPIGVFRCSETYPYDAARQGVIAEENSGVVELEGGHDFEQALQDIEGFSHIWLVFQFHKNSHWKPLVQPPRGGKKVGVFASRAPYRPNSIGMSCVRLVDVKGRRVEVAAHDLLDGTPILDIKPYVPYADCFPDATGGWIDALSDEVWTVRVSDDASKQLDWLAEHGVDCMEAFLMQQLADEPFNRKRKRLRKLESGQWEIAYRTWRARFDVNSEINEIMIAVIASGYTPEELKNEEDRYDDKDIHRTFVALFE